VEDLPARIIAAAGLVIALGSIGLTWYLWQRSGPALRVGAFVRPETGTVRIEVASTGRLTATVRRLELRDQFVLKTRGGYKTEPISRWSIAVQPNELHPGEPRTLPADLPPSAFLEGDVEVQAVLDLAAGAPEVTVAAWAERGDGKWFASKPVRLR
jgi:hypothetical protein